jgi:esterase/lipase superfamily enzyme
MPDRSIRLFYATNRNHEGSSRWKPTGYGTKYSNDGMENLRFGQLDVQADPAEVSRCLAAEGDLGAGDGNALAGHLTDRAGTARIEAYPEKIDRKKSDLDARAVLGSAKFFADLQAIMRGGSDAVVFIHGFNVSWHSAVGTAAALQVMLNRPLGRLRPAQVVLFSWPSDGQAIPIVSYKSDRSEARGSGYAIGRGFLKLRDFLQRVRRGARGAEAPCDRNIHLLCHSMGNYALQNALERVRQFTGHSALPRIFDQVFLCSPDVDDNVLEPGQPMGDLHEVARRVTVYYNSGDAALRISDYTKGNPDRLGTHGPARPALLHSKVHQVDCSAAVGGLVEHSYYMDGRANVDLQLSIAGAAEEDPARPRRRVTTPGNVWALE